jgi:hypothetical protein
VHPHALLQPHVEEEAAPEGVFVLRPDARLHNNRWWRQRRTIKTAPGVVEGTARSRWHSPCATCDSGLLWRHGECDLSSLFSELPCAGWTHAAHVA